MKNIFSKIIFSAMVLVTSFVFSVHVHAYVTPTLSVYGTSDGDSVQVNAYADPNVSITLYYLKSGAGQQIISLGNTNSSGFLSTTVSSSQYGVMSNSPVHITANGINGISSSVVNWPIVTTNITNGNLLSQTSVTVSVGQSATINTINNVGSLSVSSNSNSNVASVYTNGSTVTVTGSMVGSTTINICNAYYNLVPNCQNLYVTVQNSNSGNQITFSQTNPTISVGQNVNIFLYGGSSNYYSISSNSNINIVQASISGNSLNVYGLSYGSSVINVCSSNGYSCGQITIMVSGNNQPVYNTSTTFLNVTQSKINILTGQNTTLSVSGGSGSGYNMAYISGSGIISGGIAGNIVTVRGIRNGYAVMVICDSLSNCVPVSVVVGNTINPLGNQYRFTQYLSFGSTGAEVVALQQRLTQEGVYSGPIIGVFGPMTQASVQRYQSAHGIPVTGVLDSLTQNMLNAQLNIVY
ncbi:MAG: peptidoglycan-binding domain-containing protein [bacterium]